MMPAVNAQHATMQPPGGPVVVSAAYAPYRRLLTPQRVRELSRLRPWRVMRDTALCWACILLGWALAAWGLTLGGWAAWLACAAAIVIVGNRYYALFVLGHDGMHRRIFDSGPKSELFTDLFHIGCIGMVCRVNARNHLLHHQHLAHDDDPDLHKHACFNKATRGEFLLFLTGLSSVVSVLTNLFRRGERDAGPAPEAPARGRHSLRDAAIVLTWQVVLVVGLTALVGVSRGGATAVEVVLRGWFGYPLLWVVPVYVMTYLPNLVRSFAEHSHPEADDAADTHRLITYLPGPVERVLMAPMHMNYHIAHHLWPSIPYYNLPIADAEVRAAAGAGLTWRGSYVGYLWRYWVALPIGACLADRRRARRRAVRAGDAA